MTYSPTARTNFRLADLIGWARYLQRLLPPFPRERRGHDLLERLATLPLTARSSLALVRVQQETLLLAITPESVTLLTKTPPLEREDERAGRRCANGAGDGHRLGAALERLDASGVGGVL